MIFGWSKDSLGPLALHETKSELDIWVSASLHD